MWLRRKLYCLNVHNANMQSVLSQNHFELFGLPVSFEIDLADLSTRYRELQRAAHPDKYASAPDQERRMSVQHAAQINEAFQTLKSPLARARYLLTLHHIDTSDESNTVMDPEFLMEQMELRESLGDVRDSEDPHGRLGALMRDIETRMQGMTQQLSSLFQDESSENFQKASEIVLKLQFIYKLREEAEQMEEELF